MTTPMRSGLKRKDAPARRGDGAFDQLITKTTEVEFFLKALANRHRLMILCELHKSERCVTDLQNAVGLSQSALSQHLARLRQDRLVATRRESRTIYYSLADARVVKTIATLHDTFCAKGSASF
jgi:DNA-binding transcriptional ArsR family regulator